MDTGGIPSNNEVIERCASERVALELGASLPRSVGVFEIKIAAQIEDFKPPI